MERYVYDGPIMIFGRCVDDRWHGETVAATKQKAVSNLKYQCRKLIGLVGNSKIDLPGSIRVEGE